MRRLVVACLTLAAAGLHAQQATFRSSAHLIVQTVSVKDKNGKPVEGLTAKDFIVTENGVPQEIAFIEYQKLDGPGAVTEQKPDLPGGLEPITQPLTSVPLPGDQ
jgi:hypothetical protein